MFGFKVVCVDYTGNLCGSRHITTQNEEGHEICYFERDDNSRIVEFSSDPHGPRDFFCLTQKTWLNAYEVPVDRVPSEWYENYFKVVDAMIAHLNKGPQDLV